MTENDFLTATAAGATIVTCLRLWLGYLGRQRNADRTAEAKKAGQS